MTHKPGFRPDIEGLRAVAVVLVLLFHAQIDWFSGGFLGVDVFFVLSGFLITRLLVEEAAGTGSIRLREFWSRRIRRLLPASVTVLAVTALGVWQLLPYTSWRAYGGDVTAAAAYVVNWRLAGRAVDYLAEGIEATPVQHYWSLAVEEQFYLVWPILILIGAWIASRRGWSLRRTTAVLLVAVVAIPSFTWSVWLTSSVSATAFFVTTTRLWELAVGGLAVFVVPHASRFARGLLLTRLPALVVIVWAAVAVNEASAWPGWLAGAPVLATALLLVAGENAPEHDPIQRVLALPPMQRVGAWSYSLYLWHWPPLAILAARWGGLSTTQAVAIVAGSFVPAWLSFRFVENPVRRHPRLVGSPRLTLGLGAGLSLAGVVAGLAVAWAIPTPPTTSPPIVTASPSASPIPAEQPFGAASLRPGITNEELLAALAATTSFIPAPDRAVEDLPVTYPDKCHTPQDQVEPRVCTYGDETADTQLAILGDSKMAQWTPALIELAERNHWRLVTYTKSACELSRSPADRNDGRPYPECQEWADAVLDLVAADPPDVALVSQVSSHALVETTAAAATSRLVDGMMDAYDEIRALGTEVVVILDNPHPGFTVYECVAQHLDDLSACTFGRDEQIGTGGRSTQLEAITRGGYLSIDMLDLVCPTADCVPVIGGVLVYRQGSHLTATYVLSMADELGRRLLQLAPSLSSTA